MIDYSIKSWLNIHYPANRFEVYTHEKESVFNYSDELNISSSSQGEGELKVSMRYIQDDGLNDLKEGCSYRSSPGSG